MALRDAQTTDCSRQKYLQFLLPGEDLNKDSPSDLMVQIISTCSPYTSVEKILYVEGTV